MKYILLLTLLACASKNISVLKQDEAAGALTYENYENIKKREFLNHANAYIHCNEAYKDISEVPYDEFNADGTFQYQCLKFAESCKEGNGQSCLIIGVESLKNGSNNQALDYFRSSCANLNIQGCYLAGVYTPSLYEAKRYFENACTLEHKDSCEKLKQLPTGQDSASELSFLENYLSQKDVRVSDSGLAYRILAEGSGKIPAKDQKVRVRYRGTLEDGRVFDETKSDETREFGLDQVILGWKEGLQYIKEGGKIQLVIPSHLAYGPNGVPGSIPPNETLKFEIELVEIL